jgi:class 3 adenylate cyclase
VSEIIYTTIIAVLIWSIGLAVFLYALRARWFARFEQGFFFSLVIAMAAIAILATSVTGIWGYLAAKHSIDAEMAISMRAIGDIVETQVMDDIARVHMQLGRLGTLLAPIVAPGSRLPTQDLRDRLNAMISVDPHYLQMRILDEQGTVLIENVDNPGEPVNRIGVAYALDGKPFTSEAYFSKAYNSEVIYIAAPIQAPGGPVEGAVTAIFDIQDELSDLVGKMKFNESGYAVVVDGEGHIVAHPDRARLDQNILNYAAVQLARQTRSIGQVVAPNAAGVTRLFIYRPLQNPSTVGKDPWVLLTEINEGEEMATLNRLRRELILGGLVLIAASVIIGQQMSRSIRKPFYAIRVFANRIGSGDLTGQLDIKGKDMAGTLSATLNDMVAGLRERDRVKEVFGRYITTQVSDKILKSDVNLAGESRVVTILFSDIRNFTGMSEGMAPHQVVSFLNTYFSEMVDAVFENGGVLDKFIGDGLMATFGSLEEQPDHPRRAVRTALRMKALLGKINGERAVVGKPPIAIGIGIHTDEVIVGNIGSSKRLEYTVIGDGVNAASRVQTLNKEFGTTILITNTTYEFVKDEFECVPMPEHELRGKHKALRFYEVVSVKQTPAAV